LSQSGLSQAYRRKVLCICSYVDGRNNKNHLSLTRSSINRYVRVFSLISEILRSSLRGVW
jgi:hypothetical protein